MTSLIAISGLGGHAFGSFKEKGGSHMWLRDSLPNDLPKTRILIYGYDTQLENSTSFQSIDDLGISLRSSINNIRNYKSVRKIESYVLLPSNSVTGLDLRPREASHFAWPLFRRNYNQTGLQFLTIHIQSRTNDLEGSDRDAAWRRVG
jgi:hypothetical protein